MINLACRLHDQNLSALAVNLSNQERVLVLLNVTTDKIEELKTVHHGLTTTAMFRGFQIWRNANLKENTTEELISLREQLQLAMEKIGRNDLKQQFCIPLKI